MKFAVFGLSISSAWGNGHATLLRGLFRVLHSLGHEVHFFEQDTPYYAAHRDVTCLPYAQLHFYSDWSENLREARALLREADVGMVTSYCPHGRAACDLLHEAGDRLRTVFYDMDTPVTLSRLEQGETVPYLPLTGLGNFDLVLSYTGGEALNQLRTKLGARRVAALYGWVDPEIHSPVPPSEKFAANLSYLGTYAADRQQSLEQLLVEPARELPKCSFVVAGAMYTNAATWPGNVRYFPHIAPPDHASFYCSSPLTLSITRATMAATGYCPSGRLFEAAACGTAVVSDWWEGLDGFFEPGSEILIAKSKEEAVAALTADQEELKRIGGRARERTLACHTAAQRATDLLKLIENLPSTTETSAALSGRV